MEINAFSSIKPEEQNKSASNDNRTAEQKIATSQSNNVTIVQSAEEKVHLGPDNTYISLCRDRPGEIGTGAEYISAGAIYICAGASYGVSDKTPRGENNESLKANRNFKLDASGIYISANCDIDDYFGLSAGKTGKAKDSAAIAVKSTNLRLIGRNSIKLVTRTDITNENLAPADMAINGIELIAGNDASGLEPIVKGDALTAAMDDLTQIVVDICDTVEHLIKQQSDFNAVLASHKHPVVFNILAGLICGLDPTLITEGQTLESMKVQVQGELTNAFMVGSMLPDMQKHKTNIQNWFIQYSLPQGDDYFGSRYNKVN